MCRQDQLSLINTRISDSYHKVFGDDLQAVFLYGSYARGDFDNESDIDYVGIVRGDRLTLQNKMSFIWDFSAELGLENDVVISPTVIPANEFEKYKNILPYYKNIRKEGILVG